MKIKNYFVLISSSLICLFLAFFEHSIEINYVIKTFTKVVLFLLNIWLYIILFKDYRFKSAISIIKIKKREWIRVIVLGFTSASIVLIAYILLQSFIDLSQIKLDLTKRLGITATGYIFVGLYVALGNSFLEEYYFRGFIFSNLPRRIGYIFSPLLFAIYHIPMIMLWFSPLLILLCFIALWVIGLIFHRVNEYTHTIWSSWIIHICADMVIIVIGYTIFY